MHQLLTLCFTPEDFSPRYKISLLEREKSGNAFARFLFSLARIFPKWKRQNVNRNLRACIRWCFKNPFPTPTVANVTFIDYPEVLCANGQRIVTLVESWDHCVKRPMGYVSEVAFLWNQSLTEDWKAYQGDLHAIGLYPLKLRYALQSFDGPAIKETDPRKLLLYPASYGSNAGQFFEAELEIIEIVCRSAKRAGWDVIIKPHPAGASGEFDAISRKFAHVSIGTVLGGSGTNHYYLDDHYNKLRFSELRKSNLVVNLYTTFVLDASLAYVPSLQLNLTGNENYPVVSRISNNQHLQKYLFVNRDLCLNVSSEMSLEDEIHHFLEFPDERASLFAVKMRNWLDASASLEEAVETVVAEMVS